MGEVVTKDCVRSVRPGYGLAPSCLESVLGRKLTFAVKASTPVTLEVLIPSGSSPAGTGPVS